MTDSANLSNVLAMLTVPADEIVLRAKMKACDIARLCCKFYSNLPKKGKPVLEQGEWTVMSAFVVNDPSSRSCEVVALGTGTKCLAERQVASNGMSLNDASCGD